MFTVTPVPAYQDNYIWVVSSGGEHWIVDPGDSVPVQAYLENVGAVPTGILVTHKHWDHVTGLKSLVESHHLPVFGPAGTDIPEIDRPVTEGDTVILGGLTAQVWRTPGHTCDHVSYYLPEANALFCGDTLFSGGCGRVFDGTIEQLYASLMRIASLPEDTQIYCTHEYTLANLAFAAAVEPNNRALASYREHCQTLRDSGLPTLPTNVARERAINPFLRVHNKDVQDAVCQQADVGQNDPRATFTALRHWKNHY